MRWPALTSRSGVIFNLLLFGLSLALSIRLLSETQVLKSFEVIISICSSSLATLVLIILTMSAMGIDRRGLPGFQKAAILFLQYLNLFWVIWHHLGMQLGSFFPLPSPQLHLRSSPSLITVSFSSFRISLAMLGFLADLSGVTAARCEDWS